MATTWNIKPVACLAIAVCLWAAGSTTFAADGTASWPGQERVGEQGLKRGRSVIFRAGELPHVSPESPEPADAASKPALPTHYLDTTLPILIQGAPHELSLGRYVATS